MELGVSTGKVPGGWLVEVSGEVDLHTAAALRSALDTAVDQARADASNEVAQDVLVDLSDVGFMDSTGLGELVGAHKALSRSGGRLHLVVGNDRVGRLITLTSLDEVLEVHHDRASALASMVATS